MTELWLMAQPVHKWKGVLKMSEFMAQKIPLTPYNTVCVEQFVTGARALNEA